MAHRQSYTRRTSSYGGQDPYSPPSRQQTAARSPPPSSAAADSSRPTLLAGQHARYSSADLYALQAQPATRQSQQHPSRRPSEEAPRRMSSQAARGWESDDEDEDDDDDDDGPGFASYGEAPTQRRSYQAPHPAPVQQQRAQQQQQQQQQAMYQNPYQYQAPAEQWTTRPVAPPIVSHPSRMTTKSAFDFTIAEPAAASTAKIESDWIDAPILSKTDWKHGEALTVKHEHDAEKQRRKRDKVKGEVMDLSLDCGEFLRRNWKWIVPLLVFLSVAAIICCYFLIPRTPTISFDSPYAPSPAFTANDSSPYISSADPTSFSFDASIAFAIDASKSYLAVNYHSFDLTVRIQETGGIIAQQSYGSGDISVPGRKVTSYEFPITFAGNYTNSNNPTYQIVRSACAHKYATIYRPPLNLTIQVDSSIIGVVKSPSRIARLDAVDCPVEWLKTAS
ncbi:hypothetical protein BMF94_4857 [Rhodotorula taiwanensis]|uniref:Uncharacterized protein n=1 Tax=Rhodotorula taiwanensis TaxID=741276 RepID=A0A2S5B5V9_9BASI|nr:hypothetical protein BMF94_4857 [Rhodotorula taiwanensis]